MISAFGVDHGEISKADDDTMIYRNSKRKGDKARNYGLAAAGVGAANGGIASGRAISANMPMYQRAMETGVRPSPSEIKVPRGMRAHQLIGLGALGAAGTGLAINRVNRHAQRKAAQRKLG